MKKILINSNPWQTRIAITKDGLLLNIYYAASAQKTLERAYFRGIVSKILPGIQTAFVDIGQERAGFLHISEIDRELAIERISKQAPLDDDEDGEAKKPAPRRSSGRPDISKILKEGESVLVQVSKEPVYEKGAKLSTCFTLPGRFIVLMPNIPRIGVSKKIEDRDERMRLKSIVRGHLPEGMGAIIRTTSQDRGEQELVKDLTVLVGMWQSIQEKFAQAEPQAKIHEDIDLSLQAVRDHLDDDVEEVITDTKKSQSELYRFVKNIAPEYASKIKLYEGPCDLFQFYGIEKQIEMALDKKVSLKSGGSLIIETTEAMTVVDVNTGRFTGKSNMEDTILKTNMEAAEEVARQLRLRNIGGLIVIDFIDMALGSNRQKLFKFFEKTLREQDKFQSVVLKISEFGLVQMTRKRSGKTLQQQLMQNCSTCTGTGVIKSVPTESYDVLGKIRDELEPATHGSAVTLHVHPQVFEFLTSTQYNAILDLEKKFSIKITLLSDKRLEVDSYKIEKT